MKRNVNQEASPTIFLKTKGRRWFDDQRSSTSSKDDGNSQQEGDSTISNEEGEILDEEQSNQTQGKSVRILKIQDFPPQELLSKDNNSK